MRSGNRQLHHIRAFPQGLDRFEVVGHCAVPLNQLPLDGRRESLNCHPIRVWSTELKVWDRRTRFESAIRRSYPHFPLESPRRSQKRGTRGSPVQLECRTAEVREHRHECCGFVAQSVVCVCVDHTLRSFGHQSLLF